MSTPKIKEFVTMTVHAKSNQLEWIDLVAEKQGRSRSEFMLDVACREAKDYLLDQANFSASAKTFGDFQSMLGRPLPQTDRLHRLLKTKAPWDK